MSSPTLFSHPVQGGETAEQAYCLLMIGLWRVIYLTPLDGEGVWNVSATLCGANRASRHLRCGRLRFAPTACSVTCLKVLR